jgi:hypothetical protein
MSTYTLSGSGTQTLTANTTAAHLTITTLPAGLPKGRANPVNNFEIGLIRFGDGTGFWEPIPVLGGPQWIGIPNGATQFGYSMLNGSVVSFVEVIGGVNPFYGAGNAGVTLISKQQLSAPATTIQFSSIPQTFSELILTVFGRTNVAASNSPIFLRFNGDSTGSYDSQNDFLNGSTGGDQSFANSAAEIGWLASANAPSNVQSGCRIWIPGYANTTFFKVFSGTGLFINAFSSTQVGGTVSGGNWRNTGAISSITVLLSTAGNMLAGTEARLYGIS